jgi:DnaJ domain
VNQRMRTREWSGVDYYAELGLAQGASSAAIDEAYRRQAKELHPDRNPDPTAEERFKRLSAAYEVLRDPVSRQAYEDFRFRVDAGLLYRAPSQPAPAPTYATTRPVTSQRRRKRKPMPDGVRVAIGWILIAMGVATALWALVGPLPSHSAGDTELAVQITIGVMAAKLLVGGGAVMKYPQLKARWHRPPGGPTGSPTVPGDQPSLENLRNLT